MKKMMSLGMIWCLLLGSVSLHAAEVDAVRVVVGEAVITDLDIDRLANIMIMQGRIDSSQRGEPGFRVGLVNLSIQRELIKQSAPLAPQDALPASALQTRFLEASQIAATDLPTQLASYHITQADLEQYLQDEYQIQRNQGQYLHQKIQVSAPAVKQYIAKYNAEHTTYNLVDFYIPRADKAPSASQFKAHMDAARNQYQSGSPVQAPVIAVDLSNRTVNDLPDLYQQVVPQLAVDTLSYMIVAENGYHALFLLDKQAPPAISNEAAQQQLFSAQAGSVLSRWLDELKSSTFVKIYAQ
jgi:hypothetical protein